MIEAVLSRCSASHRRSLVGAVDALPGKQIGFGFYWLLISAAIVILYFALMDGYAGATLGKFAFGLRVSKHSRGIRRKSTRRAARRK